MAIVKDHLCWPSVHAAIHERIAEIAFDLETADADRVPRLQGEVAGLRWLLREAETPEPNPDTPLY